MEMGGQQGWVPGGIPSTTSVVLDLSLWFGPLWISNRWPATRGCGRGITGGIDAGSVGVLLFGRNGSYGSANIN